LTAPAPERKQFAALTRRVEAIRVREGLTKRALAAEIGTSEDALRNWLTGRALGRAETVALIKPQEERICESVSYCSAVILSTKNSLRSRPSRVAASAIVRGIDQPTATCSRTFGYSPHRQSGVQFAPNLTFAYHRLKLF